MFAGVRPVLLSICLQWLFAGWLPAPSLTPPPPVPGFHRDSWDSRSQDPASRSGHREGDLGFSHQPISCPWKLRSSWQLGLRWKVFQLQWLPTGSLGRQENEALSCWLWVRKFITPGPSSQHLRATWEAALGDRRKRHSWWYCWTARSSFPSGALRSMSLWVPYKPAWIE